MRSQKCSSCGGDVVFNPKKQMLQCVQCGSLTQVKTVATSEKSFQDLLRNAPQWKNDAVVYHCENCGAKAVVNKSDLAIKCDYCGATNIVRIEDLPGIRPDSIVTFKITKDEAVQSARKTISKRFFAPGWFKKSVNADHINGFYYPAFTFDAQTSSTYTGVLATTVSHTTYINGKAIVTSQTVRRPIGGNYHHDFDDILIPATNAVPQPILDELAPFSTNDANVYQKEFLSGYTASHYTKDAMQCWEAAKGKMEQTIRSRICNKYNGTVENLSVNTSLSNITYKYTLLPMYVGHTESEGKKYDLYINGQTGKVSTKTPTSVWKVLLVGALGLMTVGAAIALALFLN